MHFPAHLYFNVATYVHTYSYSWLAGYLQICRSFLFSSVMVAIPDSYSYMQLEFMVETYSKTSTYTAMPIYTMASAVSDELWLRVFV